MSFASKIILPFAAIGIGLSLLGNHTGPVGDLVPDLPNPFGPAQVKVGSQDQATFDRLCPLVDAYLQVDDAGKAASEQAVNALAAEAAATTQDPAVHAFLSTVPAALNATNNTQRAAARALVSRECAAHGNRVSGE